MATELKVKVDGDPHRVYFPNDTVRGVVSLTTSSQDEFKQLKLNFRGQVKTMTTRPYYVSGNENSPASRKTFRENVTMFDQEKVLFQGPYKLSPTLHEWNFEYTFPARSETVYQKSVKSSHYNKQPHDLPPSFRCITESYRGEGCIHYGIEATLIRGSFKPEIRHVQYLLFRRRSERPLPAKAIPHVLETQQVQENQEFRPRVDKFGKAVHQPDIPSAAFVQFVPTFHAPQAVVPKQVIDLGLSIRRTRHQGEGSETFKVERLKLDLLTTTRVSCGGVLSQTQDVVCRTIPCIDRKLPGIAIPTDDTPIALTRNFSLTDDDEASPSFKSYTVSRVYHINVSIMLRWRDKTLRVSSSIELDILPRYDPPRRRRRSLDEELVDPLPLYTRAEHAPAYEEVATAQVGDVREQRLLFERTFSESLREEQAAVHSSEEESEGVGESSDELYTSEDGSATPPTPFLSRVSSAVPSSVTMGQTG